MDELKCLQQLYDEEMDKLFSCSANYLMTIPKKGCEMEHELHRERADILKNLIDDLTKQFE